MRISYRSVQAAEVEFSPWDKSPAEPAYDIADHVSERFKALEIRRAKEQNHFDPCAVPGRSERTSHCLGRRRVLSRNPTSGHTTKRAVHSATPIEHVGLGPGEERNRYGLRTARRSFRVLGFFPSAAVIDSQLGRLSRRDTGICQLAARRKSALPARVLN